MNHEIQCEDDKKSLSKERKQKKDERRKKKKESLKDRQNSEDVEQACDHVAQNTSPEVVTKTSKKKHKREKRHHSNSVSDETVCEEKKGHHSINRHGKIKRQKTDSIEQTTKYDASYEEIKSKKKKRKKEKTISKDQSFDSNQLSEVCQKLSEDIAMSAKKKRKKEKTISKDQSFDSNQLSEVCQKLSEDIAMSAKKKKSKDIVPDGENVMPAKIDSTLHEMDCDVNHEIKSKKQNHRVHSNKDEKTEVTKRTDSKENHSRPTKKELSKKKKKKHSKHKDFESVDKTDSNIPRKKNKKKSKSTCCVGGSDKDITDEHISVKIQDVTSDEKHSKHHKKHKSHSKKSPTASHVVKNINMNQEICSESSKHGKTTSDQMIKSEQSPDCSAVALGNWQGNLFESNERQNKFLRLLGGMKKSNDTAGTGKGAATIAGTKKKGLFASLTSLSNTTSSGKGVALDVDAAASLNQKLEDEYNKAMNFKLSGKVGSGFGFAPDPAEGKKFHIDVNKSKSVKFDDN